MECVYITKLLKTDEEVSSDENKHFIYVESRWQDNSLELHLHTSDSNKTFKGELSAEQFGQCATELDISFDEFYAECKEALTANITLPPFVYTICEDEQPTFRLIKKGNFAIDYLEVPLKALKNNCALLEAAVNLINDLREARNEKLKESKKDDSTYKELLLELNNCNKEKESMEKKLLGRFLLLLNSKKSKINELKDKLRENSDMRDAADQGENDDFEALTQQEV